MCYECCFTTVIYNVMTIALSSCCMYIWNTQLWHPKFFISVIALMAESAESNRSTLVKPRSTWVITSKTEPTTPIDPLDQVNTHLWSTLGQKHGQTPLKPWRLRMSSGTFAAFSKFHLNTSKSPNMNVVQFFEGHNFHVEWHFKFWVEKDEKLGQLLAAPVHRNRVAFKVWQQFVQKPRRKTPYNICKSCRG
jgi:hypothetical protein